MKKELHLNTVVLADKIKPLIQKKKERRKLNVCGKDNEIFKNRTVQCSWFMNKGKASEEYRNPL